MDRDPYGSSSYGSQFRSPPNLPSDTMSQDAFMSDGSGYDLHPTQNVSGYQASPYMASYSEGRTAYTSEQESYSNTVYPNSAQRTRSMTTSLGLGQEAIAVSQLSNVRSNHYEATFDFDTPHFPGPASGNSSMFDRYGTSFLRNASTDHRNPPSPTMVSGTPMGGSHSSNTHVHSYTASSTNPHPLYCPTMSSPPRPMTSYSAESSSSNSPPSSLFPKVHPTNLSEGPGFDIPLPSADLNIVYGDPPQHYPQHHRRNLPSYADNTPNGTSSIPMSTNAPVNWNSDHHHKVDVLRHRPYSSSSLSPSSATTPMLSATLLSGGDSGRLLPGAGASTVALSQRTPYGPPHGRPSSSSVTPPLDEPPSADPGSKSESDAVLPPPSSGSNGGSALGSLRRGQDVSAPPSLQRKQTSHPTSGARSAAQGPTDIGADGQHHLQPPTKKKKKSKMHTCEICSKKFPRPSGLRTHMNTHNNARPYACGFPGCTRTFGVRSNAKRHLRTHGIVPPPSNPSNSGETQYVVGFSPPVIAPAPAGSAGAGIASDGNFYVTDGTSMANGGSKPRVGRTPMFKLRWMPPSLTSRTNAAKLKVVDEVTGEVSEDETESEEGEDEGDGSDRDYDDPSGDGFEDEPDYGRRGSNTSGSSMLSSLGGMSMPSLMPVGGAATVNNPSAMETLPPAAPSRSTSYSSLFSISSTSTATTAGCVCPFSPCLSNPCRTLNGTSSYTSSPVMDHSAASLGTYSQTSALRSMTMPDFTMGSLHNMGRSTIGSLSISSPPSRSMDVGFGGLFGSSGTSVGVSSLYARRVASALNTGHHTHLLASA